MAAPFPCPKMTCGVWKQDFNRSESLCPFMDGLFPWPLSSVACTVADYTPVTLRIVCKSNEAIEIVDKTTFGRNVTEASLDGSEVETLTRGGRKSFMLSGSVVNDVVTIKCRLHERGLGWETRQERFVDPKNPNVLVECNVLERPDKDPVTITRYFNKTKEDVQSAYEHYVNDLKEYQQKIER